MDYYAMKGETATSSSEALFKADLKKVFETLSREYKSRDLSNDYDSICAVIKSGEDMDEYFDFLGNGSFKEVYHLNNLSNHVLKVCSQLNPTDAEQALLELAREEKIGYVFIPTYFVNLYGLACGMPNLLENIDCSSQQVWNSKYQEWTENQDWEGRYGTALEIQPVARTFANVHPDECHFWDYYQDYGVVACYQDMTTHIEKREPGTYEYKPVIDRETGKEIRFEVINKLDITCRKWVEDFVNCYGGDALEKLATFLCKYSVGDLHGGNLGYCEDQITGELCPVLLDWMSPDRDILEERKEKEN